MKKNGFTLIEILAVVVIVALIAIIAVPQVMKVISTSRKSAAIDSTEGIVNATDQYINNVMAKNQGSFPKNEIVFECVNRACTLTLESETYLESYEHKSILDLNKNNIKGGTIKITERGKTIEIENLQLNGYTCEYKNHNADCN